MDGMYAVIDIGMTNKKVAIYDESLHQVDVAYKSFEPVMVEGLPTHDLAGMEAWFLERLADAASKYPIKAISVTAHGATFVCVDSDGTPCVPCVFYTHEPGDAFHDRFYEKFGDPVSLQQTTGTPSFKAMINSAQGLYFASERFPEGFAKTVHVLDLPQYWGFRLTGKAAAEGTYVGCHTYLWDWTKNEWSSVARSLGIADKLPKKVSAPWDVLGTVTEAVAGRTGLASDVAVTVGIHDSNSSLLPHFAVNGETRFMLNSTGTWCVVMNPVKEYGFKKDELGKVVFFNRSAFGSPVKTAIFLGGREFEDWSKLASRAGATRPTFDATAYNGVLAGRRAFILPELVAGSGQFPGSRPCIVEDGKRYEYEDIVSGKSVPPCLADGSVFYPVLAASLAIQTLVALERAGIDGTKKIFTEGGFRKDAAFAAILSQALPENRCYLTDIAEATALGAAIIARMAVNGLSLSEAAGNLHVEYTEAEKRPMSAFEEYKNAWLKLVGGAQEEK